MTDDATPRWALPMIHPGQAQKEMAHNEALARIDLLLCGAVADSASVPPDMPEPGDAWIVAAPATDAWAGRETEVACWTIGGWRFVEPQEGMTLWYRAADQMARFDGTVWRIGEWRGFVADAAGRRVTGERQAAIDAPTGGFTVDSEARTAVSQVLSAMQAHGLIEPLD
ncbi:DUF2793 domain-containing protein [Sphingomonas sp. CJ99]